MKARVINISEIAGKDNKRHCLSAKRALDRCFECPSYGQEQGQQPCESRIINKAYNELVKKKREVRDRTQKELNKLNEEIDEL